MQHRTVGARITGMTMNATVRRLAPPFLVIVAACGRGNGQAAGPAGNGAGGPARPVPVEIALAELGTAAREVTATGTVEPIRTITINSQLAGSLLGVMVEEGDAVRAGTTLARIDSRELEAQLTSARAALEVSERAAGRAEQLRAQEIITVAEYERDKAAHAAAQASFDQLRTRIGYAAVRSPLAGVVLQKHVEMGDVVAAQTELFTIGDISTLVVRLAISELDVIALQVGDTVDVALDAVPGRPLPGRIRRIFPSGDPTTRLVPVEVALQGTAAREARPGFLARVRFRLDPRDNVLLVPQGALVQDAGGSAAFVIAQGRAARRPVRRGDTYQGRVEIIDGLAAGDTVAVAGNTMLRDGAAIRIVKAPVIEAGPAPLPRRNGS